MFETAEIGREVSKKDYKEKEPPLRESLLLAQQRLRRAPFSVVVLFAGVDGAGKGQTVNLLNVWMDPRWIHTRAFGDPSEEERERPEYWRFWRELPPKGNVGLLLSAWYSKPLLQQVYEPDAHRFEEQLEEIAKLEKTLAEDGAVIIKFWMHLGKQAQHDRLRTLEADPLMSWRVTKRDWKHWKWYDRFAAAAERMISRTSTGQSPWHITEGVDARYRSLRVGELLLDAMETRLDEHDARQSANDEHKRRADPGHAPAVDDSGMPTVLSGIEMTVLDKGDYEEALKKRQGQLNSLQRAAKARGISMVLVFEGWDAAGKGGAIRRVTRALDARDVRVIPIAAPTDEERAQHYLWRFWRHLSRAGRVTVFDRSWYGRVLVERVEGFATHEQWRRAFSEIRHFERQLCDHGIVVVKFWLHITPQEQLERFERRQNTPYKSWKLTEEDWRNREKWPAYEAAVHDMVERTSTGYAPWHLVAANDKRHARVAVLGHVCDALEAALSRA